ncbi:MAG: CHAT domain-containing protein, partial [Bacteroidota bacterium]
ETKIYGKIIDQRKLYPYDLDGQALVGSGSTTGAGGIKPLKVGKGQAATSGRNGSSGSYSTPVLIHKTVKDNRLSAIATELGYSARELASLNNMKEDEIVKAGTELKVPRKKDEDDLDFEITPVEHIEKNYDEYNVYEWYDWDEAELDSTYYMNMEANTKTKLKQYSQAASIYEDIRLTHERKLVKNYRNYTIDLYNLANVYKLQKRYSKAEAIYLEIQSILETVYGPTDPGYVKNLNDLASLQHEQGKYSSAEQMKVRAVAMVHDQLSSAIMYSSERDMAGYLHYELDRLKDIPSYLYSGHYGANMKGAAYNDALFQKGFLQTVAQRLNLLSADIPEADSLKKLLKRYRNDLYKERLKEIDKRINAPQLEEKIDELERSITLKITGNKEPVSLVQWQEVQSALKPNEAAIEFLRFPVLLPRKTDSVMYAALIIRPGTDSPEFIPLFEERDLAALLKTNGSTNTSSLYGGVDRGFIKSGSNKKISLYQLIWNPVSQSLKDVETLYYSSAGLLYRINIGAICIAPKTMLSHQYKFVQLGSTRQIVSSDDSALKNRNAVLMGGIQYEADSTAIQAAIGELDQLAVQNIRGGQYYFQSDSTGRYIERWNSLEFTEMETADISAILENAGYHTNRLSGYQATEEVFHVINAKGGSPRVLHIATHGFFLPDPKESGAESQNNVYKRSENPLIRSGIILAGGNHAWATGEPVKPGLEDGILTAYEISQINLSNTELVVLSACETGLGDIQGNEGVYGLQRALKIAGVRYLVMSLWKVPDEQTAEFMKRFYQNWLEKGMTIPDAFRLTQHEMRERFINPHSWAGFVLIE